MTADRLTIEGDTVEAVSPEGVRSAMPLPEFLEAVTTPPLGDLITPDGIRYVRSTSRMTVMVWEIPPRVHHVKWISAASPSPFRMGPGSVNYDERDLAMPYLLIVAVFCRDREGVLTLSGHNEAYFRTAPITGPDDPLCFTSLLNVSKFPDEFAATRPLAWICTQYTPLRDLAREPDPNRRVRRSLAALKGTLLESGFNYSSEHHELTSYWTLSSKSIPQIADLDRWETLSRKDPLFVLEVPWLEARAEAMAEVPLTVRTLADRIIAIHDGADHLDSAAALARVVHHHRRPRGRRAG